MAVVMDGQHSNWQDAKGISSLSDRNRNMGEFDELPPPDTKRWVIRRKAAVVNAVRRGRITLEEACERYNLSVEEFMSWQQLIEKHGVPGLRVTRLQEYRPQS